MKIKSIGPTISTIPGLLFAVSLLFVGAQTVQAQWSGNPNIYYNGGNVGIGTASPTTKLDVAGIAQVQTLGINSGSYSGTLNWGNNSYAVWYMTGSDFNSSIRFKTWDGSLYSDKVTFQNNGNVGIGTASPATIFHVKSANPVFTINDGTNSGFSQKGQFKFTDSADTERLNLGLIGDGSGDAQFKLSNDKKIRFYTNAVERMTIDGGNVGIGTASPNQKLHVAGNINVTATATEPGDITLSGTIYAKYQDVAEWVPSSEQLAVGTVVVLDSTKSNQVIASTVGYDTRVAGVISAQPGLALGEKGEGKVLVATTGRVKIKVDASKSPIRIGDLLVTSDVPGVAMKSKAVNLGGVQIHRPGTLIGKALEPLAKGKSEILVLLSLQ